MKEDSGKNLDFYLCCIRQLGLLLHAALCGPDSLNVYFVNSEDPDEMLHNAVFHLGVHCLLRKNPSS